MAPQPGLAQCEKKQELITALVKALQDIHLRGKRISPLKRKRLLDAKNDVFEKFRAHLAEHGC